MWARPRWCAAPACRAQGAAYAGGAHRLHDDRRAAGAGRLADRPWRESGGDGGDQRRLARAVLPAGGPVFRPGWSTPKTSSTCPAGPRPTGSGPSTWTGSTRHVRALTVAVQRGHVPRNVAALVDPPAQGPSDIATALDLGEARAVLEAAATVRNSARWTVALALGLRQSEALALQWKDVDLLNNTLTVRRSIHRVRGGGLIYEEPKSRRSHRTLALPLPLVAELHRHKT